jgi:hypothetical protein
MNCKKQMNLQRRDSFHKLSEDLKTFLHLFKIFGKYLSVMLMLHHFNYAFLGP